MTSGEADEMTDSIADCGVTRAGAGGSSYAVLRFLCRNFYLLQSAHVGREVRPTGGPRVRLQEEGNDIHILLTCQLAGSVERHRRSDTLEQIAQRQIVPIGCETSADERRGHVGAFE